MNIKKVILVSIVAGFVLTGIMSFMPVQTRPQPAQASFASKYDSDCTGTETAGRCADKCPVANDQGSFYFMGLDKDTGAVVCKFVPFQECPYAASLSINDPACEKLAPTTEPSNSDVAKSDMPAPETCAGK